MDFFRYGWPRKVLVKAYKYLPPKLQDRLLDFLYPDDMVIRFK